MNLELDGACIPSRAALMRSVDSSGTNSMRGQMPTGVATTTPAAVTVLPSTVVTCTFVERDSIRLTGVLSLTSAPPSAMIASSRPAIPWASL
jgi:hypothetical protein